MIVNDTHAISRKEEDTQAVVVTDLSITIVFADGTSPDPQPTVTQAPITEPVGSGLFGVELSTLITPMIAGRTEAIWKFTRGTSIIQRPTWFWVSWTDVHRTIRSLIRSDHRIVTRQDIDEAIMRVVMILLSTDAINHTLPSYAMCPYADRVALDQAISLLTSAWIRPHLPKSEAIGELVGFKAGNDEFKYSTPNKPLDPQSVEDAWAAQAYQLLALTSFFSGDDVPANSSQMMVLTGYRRGLDELSLPHWDQNPIRRRLIQEFRMPCNWSWYNQYNW